MHSCKSLLKSLALVGVVAFVSSAGAETKTWTGANSTASSNAGNWSPNGVPVDGDDIVFDDGTTQNCSWTLNIKPASWTQDGYTGTVTFNTEYDEYAGTAPKLVEITGNVVLNSGMWTHLKLDKIYDIRRQYRLYVIIGGDLSVGANAVITAEGLGYTWYYNAITGGKGSVPTGSAVGGSHGGLGSWMKDVDDPLTTGMLPYDSVTAPTEPGSASTANVYNRGGGAIRLDVAGALTLDGTINANAQVIGTGGGAGGSVYIHAASISGAGRITADAEFTSTTENGIRQAGIGSGGRIAVILTGAGSDFSSFNPKTQMSAVCYGTGMQKTYVSPGSVYVEKPGDVPGEGWLLIGPAEGNYNYSGVTAHLACHAGSVAGYNAGLVHYAKITLLDGAKALVPPGVTLDVTDTVIEGSDSEKQQHGIYLLGGTLVAPDDYTIDYGLGLAGGTVDVKKVTFAAGSRLYTDQYDGSVFTGDLQVDAGAEGWLDRSLTVNGSFTLGGTLSCSGPTVYVNPLITMDISVHGNMTVLDGGLIDLTGKGNRGGSYPTDQTPSNTHRSHGGEGYALSGSTKTLNAQQPYGSIREPILAGSGGSSGSGGLPYVGGGVLKMTVGGAFANEGTIRANSLDSSTYLGSGGSVNIRAGSISGAGTICANGGFASDSSQVGCSGGGRVAIRLTGEGADFSQYTGVISAYGSRKNTAAAYVGGAGSVWLRTAAQSDDEGTLVVRNELDTLSGWAGTLVGGAFMEPTDVTFGDVLIGSSAQLKLADDTDLYVSGDFLNECEFASGIGTTVHFIGEGESQLAGNLTFANVACDAPGKVFDIAEGSVLKVTGVAAIASPEGEAPIVLQSALGTTWTLDNSESSIVLENVALSNCTATTAGLVVKNGVDLGGNSANITFVRTSGSEHLTWTGAVDNDWTGSGNWDLGRPPLAVDTVEVPAGVPNMPVLPANVEIAELTVAEGASLDITNLTLKVNGPASLGGSIIAVEGAVLEVQGDLVLAGAVSPDVLAVRLTGEEAQAFTANGQRFATIDALAPTTAFAGDFTADTLTIGDGAAAFAATFAADATISTGDFSAKGVGAETCSLGCAAQDGTWKLKTALAHVTGVAVSGSDASEGRTVYAENCTNGGDNANWSFDAALTHWNGSAWTAGEPTAGTVAIVDADVTLNVTDDLTTGLLIVDRRATLKVDAALTADDMLIAKGATVEWNVPGRIEGDLELLPDAVLTHAANLDTEANKLDLTVGGDALVSAGAAIDVSEKGYSGINMRADLGGKAYGPGATLIVGVVAQGNCPSYGGRGYTGTYSGGNWNKGLTNAVPCYGSVTCPTNCGSAGFNYNVANAGGGAIKLTCAGTLTVDGLIASDGAKAQYYPGSGGSVWLTVGSLVGTGTIRAHGGHGTANGATAAGGGRVAVYLTKDVENGFAGTITAFGGVYASGASVHGSAGTVYVQTAADAPRTGVLAIANAVNTTCRVVDDATDLPGGLYSIPDETKNLRVEAANYGTVSLTADVTIRDVSLLDKTARLKLNGHTLTVRSFRHAVSPDDTKQIDYGEGGKIDWLTPGLMILVR